MYIPITKLSMFIANPMLIHLNVKRLHWRQQNNIPIHDKIKGIRLIQNISLTKRAIAGNIKKILDVNIVNKVATKPNDKQVIPHVILDIVQL